MEGTRIQVVLYLNICHCKFTGSNQSKSINQTYDKL